jgi:2-hydroxychromene-2-carboxylate isomerase
VGELVQFPLERVQGRGGRELPAAAFYFDVGCPLSYLAAERVERRLPGAEWVPIDGSALSAPPESGDELAQMRVRAEGHARALRLPLMWPERFPLRAPCARRAAAFACELGAGPAFALAASRLAFCGGFELDDPETIAEAAAAAAVPLGACLEAAGESWRDEEIGEVSAALRQAKIEQLPAIQVGSHWFQGEDALGAASAMMVRGLLAQGPLAPAG